MSSAVNVPNRIPSTGRLEPVDQSIIVSSSNFYLPETKPREHASTNPYNGGMYQKIYHKENEKKHGGLDQTNIRTYPKNSYQQMDESWMTHGSFQKFFQKNIPKSQLFHESTAKDSEIRR